MTTALRSRARSAALLNGVVLAVLLAGCTSQPPRPAAPISGPVLPDHVPSPVLEALPPPPPPVAVVLSADTAHYRSVADALGDGDWTRYVLSGENAARVRGEIVEAGHTQAIAIGQQALALLADSDLNVAYCQVFDAAVPASAAHRGVAPLPELGAQLDAWRTRQPTLTRIGLITGPGYPQVADRLEAAAQARSLEVSRAVVRTDKEFLYVFRRMVPEIDGFLLYPDTSVLSPVAIRNMLAYARKHSVWVLTYNRAVFEAGAALLVSADPREVARQVVAALDADAGRLEAPLSRVVVEAAFATGDGG